VPNFTKATSSSLPFVLLGAWSVAGLMGIDVAIFYFASRAYFRAAPTSALGAIGFDAVKPPSGAGSFG